MIKQRKGQSPKKGSGLATVLMVTAIATTLAFTTVGLSFHHLTATTKMGNAYYAKNLAEASLSRAIDKVLQDPNFGRTGGSATTLKTTFPDAPAGSYGLVTFEESDAITNNANMKTVKVHTSINNLYTDTPKLVPDPVPGYAVYLSSVGVCQGTERRIDAVVYVPKFPWAIASSGSIRCTSDIFLASVRAGGDPTKEADLLPASLASNSAIGEQAVNLTGNNITIKGDLQSHSGAQTGSALILGEKRLNAATVTLPSVKLSDYNTQTKPGVQNLPNYQPDAPIKGFAHRAGDLVCSDGLSLDGAVVYVDGNLDVVGGIKGSGAVIVTGKTTVSGTSTFSGDNKLAILSKGDVHLTGTPSQPGLYKGLLYSEGNFTASHTNLVGVVVANDQGSGSAGQIALDHSTVIQDNTASTFSITVSGSGGTSATAPVSAGKRSLMSGPTRAYWNNIVGGTAAQNQAAFAASPAGEAAARIRSGGSLVADRWTQTGAQDSKYSLPSPSGSYFPKLSPNETLSMPVGMALRADLSPTRFLDPVTNEYVYPVTSVGALRDPDGTVHPSGTYKMEVFGPGVTDFRYVPYAGSVAPITGADVNVKVGNNPEVAGDDPTWKTQLQTEYLARLDALIVSRGGSPMGAVEKAIAKSLLTNQTGTDLRYFGETASLSLALANHERLNATQTITFEDGTNPNYQPPTGGTSSETWAVDLNDNQVIPLAERVRVLYWRERFD